MTPTSASTLSGALRRALAAFALVLALGACGAALGAEETGRITFEPASFAEGDRVTLRYFGVNSGLPIRIAHEESTIGPLTRKVTDTIGTTSGKSGSTEFTAPSAVHDYIAEIREPCASIIPIGECGMLVASAPLPLTGPTVTAPATAFAGETVTVRWAHAPAGSELKWYLGLPSFDGTGGWRDAGTATTSSGALDVRVPGGRSSVQIGVYACTTSFFGRRCDRPLVHTTITLRDPGLSVLPSVVDPGGVISIAYDHAPVNSEVFVMYVPHWGPLARPSFERVGVVTTPGAGTGWDPSVTASGTMTFRITGAAIPVGVELWTPCHGMCGFAGLDPHEMIVRADLALAPTGLELSPDPVALRGAAEVSWTNAPVGSVIRRTSNFFGGSVEFAVATTRTGTASVSVYGLEAGSYEVHLHQECHVTVIILTCSDTLARATLHVGVTDEEISRSASPTAPILARPTLAAPSSASSAPTIGGVATAGPSVFGATPAPSGDPLAQPSATSTPEPTIVVSAPRPAVTTAPTAAPTVIVSAPPARTTAPTFAPTPTATQLPIVVPTPTPTVAPTKTATPTQQPTASPTPKPNSAPQIAKIGDQSGKAGQSFSIGVSASDADGDKITLGCSGADKFVDYGNGTGMFQWTAAKAGTYTFTCSASDGKASSSTTFAITVS